MFRIRLLGKWLLKAVGVISLIYFVVLALPYVTEEGPIWLVPESTFGYATKYNLPESKVHVDPKPHDCEWGKAPIGNKYCHFNKSVVGFNAAGDVVLADDVVFGTDTRTGKPTASVDGGKTWVYKDAPQSPRDLKVASIQIKWIKVTD